jgi:hypothetical protein
MHLIVRPGTGFGVASQREWGLIGLSLSAGFRPDQVHLYVVEHQPAGLSDYAGLPHCGGVFSPAEPDRVRRLVGCLDQETQRRAANRFDPGGRSDPAIVVVIDGWEQFESRADPTLADVSLGPTLRDVIAMGAPLGVHIVPVGGQDLLTGKVPALCNQRLLLMFPNEDTRRVHLRTGMTSPPPLPGRAIDAATGGHVQICQPTVPGTELTTSIQNAYAATAVDTSRLPRRFPSLPARVNVSELPLPQPLPSPCWIPIGVGGPDAATIGVDLFDAGPHLMFISGPPGSGRTTAIATLARLLTWNGVDVVAVASPQSPLGRMLADDEAIRVVTAATVDDGVLREAAEPFGEPLRRAPRRRRPDHGAAIQAGLQRFPHTARGDRPPGSVRPPRPHPGRRRHPDPVRPAPVPGQGHQRDPDERHPPPARPGQARRRQTTRHHPRTRPVLHPPPGRGYLATTLIQLATAG